MLRAALAALFALSATLAVAADVKPLINDAGQVRPVHAGETVGVVSGGTGATSITSHCVVVGTGTTAVTTACPGTSGQVLTSTGASANPTFQAAAVTSPGGTSGQVQYNNGGSFGGFTVSGDGTLTTSTGSLSVTKTGGVSFSAFATSTDAANLTGNIASARLTANLSAAIDTAFGSTRGSILYRGLSAWAALVPGTANYALVSNGSGADPSWQLPPAGANPLIIGTPYIRSGANQPSISDPTGSLYMRTDLGRLYVEQTIPGSAPVRVREATSATSYAVILSGAPTAGNMLIAQCYARSSAPSVNTGWTSFATQAASGNAPNALLAYHLVLSSETTSQTPCTGGTGGKGAAVVEVSGMSSVWANSYQQSGFAQANGGGTITATVSLTTSATDSFAIAFGGYTNGTTTIGMVTPSLSAGWLNTTTSTDSTSASSEVTGNKSFVTSSSTAAVTVTTGTSSGFSGGVTAAMVIVNASAGPEVGYYALSGLTTIKNAGVTATSFARSINCSTGSTCIDDGNGAITLTASGTGAAVTGSPVSGNLTKFSGTASITNGDLSGDCTTSGALAVTCTKTSGTNFGTFATQNYATPPAIGGTTPAAGAFTTLSATGILTTNVTGIAANCLRADSLGRISGAGADCATGGSGSVTSVATTAPWLAGGTITTTGTLTAGPVVKAGVATILMSNFGGL